MQLHPPRFEEDEFFTARERKTNKKNNIPHETRTCSIDVLPDELMIKIISSLTLKEAVRTSVLASRWRYLWRFTSHDLVFEHHQHLPDSMDGLDLWVSQLYGPRYSFAEEKALCAELTEFSNSVNRAMSFHSGRPGTLRIRYHYVCTIDVFVKTYDNPICNWIRFAMEKKVEKIELESCGDEIPNLHYYLSYARATEPRSNLDSLKFLRLVNFEIKDEMMEDVLSNCPHLEELCLGRGLYPKHLNIVGQSLKSLSIHGCWSLDSVTISAKNLVYFECLSEGLRTQRPIYFFKDAPLLTKASFDDSYITVVMSRSAQDNHTTLSDQLEELVVKLNWPTMGLGRDSYHSLPRFRCLKQLELVIAVIPGRSLLYFVFWAKACPLLSTFSVQFSEKKGLWPLTEVNLIKYEDLERIALNSHRHEHLKLVKFMDFVGLQNYIEFALDLLRIAKSLEKFIIYSRTETKSDPDDVVAISKDQANQLQANLPPGAELMVIHY